MKGLLNDVLDGRVFDGEILYGQVGDEAGGDGGNFVGGHLKQVLAIVVLVGQDGSVAAEIGGAAIFEGDTNEFDGRDLTGKVVEAAIVFKLAMMDDDDAFAEGGDIGHVVAGEEDGGPGAAVVFLEEGPDSNLGGDVEANGGFVEEQDLGTVEEADGEFALHSFTEREVAHGLAEDGAEFEQFIQFFERLFVVRVTDTVDGLVEQEGIGGGDVPRKAVALAHDEGDGTEEVGLALPGGEAEDVGRA